MIRVFKEPLLAFLLLGGIIFYVFQQVSGDSIPDKAEIVVTEGNIQALSTGFEKVWQRQPSDKELVGLIQYYVREEVLYREALAMGLDREDVIIKRRLRQKIEFLTEDIADLDKPSEQELQAYLTAHQEKYQIPTRYSLRQIFFNTSKRGEAALVDAKALLKTLQARDSDISNLGDRLMVQQHFENQTEREIERVMGSEFSSSLRQFPTGSWLGPVRSGFGLHLVRIDQRTDGKASQLSEVREQVIRDWTSNKRKQINEAFYETLRKRYDVKIEYPEVGNKSEISMSKAAN